MSDKVKGVIFGAVAAATYGMNPLFTLPLYKEGMTTDTVLFYRYILAVAILGVLMKRKKIPFALKSGEVVPSIAGGLLFAVSSLTLFISYQYMDAGIASTLLFVYPVMVAVIMALFFKEKVSALTMLSILLSLSGIALLYKGEGGETLSLWGVCLVMVSSLSYAIYIVGVNQSKLREMPTVKLTFYVLLFGLAVYFVRLKCGMDLQWIPSWGGLANIVMIATLPTVISLWCTALSIHYLGSTPTAILGALEPVTAVFFGVMVFGESLTPRLVAGIALIIIAVTMIIAGQKAMEHVVAIVRKKSPTKKPAAGEKSPPQA